MMTGNEYNDKANLNHEYMIVYQDMLRYLSSKDISLLVARDIRDDILAMALESQTRGLKVEEAFGDYQKFCDAVCANAVQETRLEKLLRWWRLLSSLLVLWALLDVIGIGIDESEYVKNGMLFVSWKTIMFYIMLILGSTVLVQWHNRRSFHRILGAWYTYLIAYGVLAVGFKFVLYLLSSCFHVSTGMLSIPLWLLALLAISCILSWISFSIRKAVSFISGDAGGSVTLHNLKPCVNCCMSICMTAGVCIQRKKGTLSGGYAKLKDHNKWRPIISGTVFCSGGLHRGS